MRLTVADGLGGRFGLFINLNNQNNLVLANFLAVRRFNRPAPDFFDHFFAAHFYILTLIYYNTIHTMSTTIANILKIFYHFRVTAAEYEKLYIAARGKWPKLVRSVMRELKIVYTDSADKIAAQLRAAAAAGRSALTIDMLADLQAQLMSAAEAIAARLQAEVPRIVTEGYAQYAKIDNAMISELMGATVSAAGLASMTVAVNNRLIANLLNRTWQDGYTFSERVFQVGGDYQEQIKRLVASGIAQGRGTIKIAKDIQDYVAKGRGGLPVEYGNAKFGDVVAKKVDWRALRIARSELGASMQEASIEQGLNNPAALDLFDWVRINTQIHDCECPALAAGSPYKAANVPARPHANCMCQLRPRLKDLNTVADDITRWHNGEHVEYLDEWAARYRSMS
jgi:hypothetical protein